MNDINALRTALFDTLRGLQSKEDPLDIERAKAINDTAQTIINSAKVEVDFCRTTGQVFTSGFLASAQPALAGDLTVTATGTKQITKVPGASITQHRLR
jgi:hypothetical protein